MKTVWTKLLEQLGVTTTDQAVTKHKMIKVCSIEIFHRSDWRKEQETQKNCWHANSLVKIKSFPLANKTFLIFLLSHNK